LIFTNNPNFIASDILDSVIEWQHGEHPHQELSYLFEQYIAAIMAEAGTEFCDSMEKDFHDSEPNSHPLFKENSSLFS